MIEKKKILVPSIIAIVVLLLIIVGATYAYFTTHYSDGDSTDVKITTKTTDSFVLENGDKITITANQINFAEGKGNQTDSIDSIAALKAGDSGVASDTYNVYFMVPVNEFSHSVSDGRADIILNLYGPDGSEITTGIDGLNYVTFKDGLGVTMNGWDVTNAQGLYTIAANRTVSITAEDVEKEKYEKWTMRLTLVNLAADQSNNAGRRFQSFLVLGKEINISATCSKNSELAECVSNFYATNGETTSKVYYHNGTHTAMINETETVIDAGDFSYRFAGTSDSVRNWMCFGYDDPTRLYSNDWCPADNLYRIIGTFKNPTTNEYELKLIKNTSIGTYPWSGSTESESDQWTTSTLNTETLNGSSSESYLTSLGTWANEIQPSTWYVNSFIWNESNARTIYDLEQGANRIDTNAGYEPVTNIKIGLMYATDIYFTSSNTADWKNLDKSYYGLTWLPTNSFWSISRNQNTGTSAFLIDQNSSGFISSHGVKVEKNVHPVFYLKSTTKYIGGIGSQSDPIRIK